MNQFRDHIIRKLPLALASVGLLGLASCAAPGAYQHMPQKQVEGNIRGQGIGIGAALGGLFGAAIDDDKPVRGALIGIGLGAVAGGVISEMQVQSYRRERGNTDNLAQMVGQAKSYNSEVASYNRKLRSDIREINQASADRRRALAGARRREVQVSLKNVNTTLNSREGELRKIPGGQRYQYERTIQVLEGQKNELEEAIDTLQRMEGTR